MPIPENSNHPNHHHQICSDSFESGYEVNKILHFAKKTYYFTISFYTTISKIQNIIFKKIYIFSHSQESESTESNSSESKSNYLGRELWNSLYVHKLFKFLYYRRHRWKKLGSIWTGGWAAVLSTNKNAEEHLKRSNLIFKIDSTSIWSYIYIYILELLQNLFSWGFADLTPWRIQDT